MGLLASGLSQRFASRIDDLDGDIDLCLFRGRTQVVCAESSSDDELLDHTVTTAGTHAVMLRLDDDVLAPGNTSRLQMFRSV